MPNARRGSQAPRSDSVPETAASTVGGLADPSVRPLEEQEQAEVAMGEPVQRDDLDRSGPQKGRNFEIDLLTDGNILDPIIEEEPDPSGGFATGGMSGDAPLSIQDAMQGNIVDEHQGGSGGTGGDMTGERTPGGMSEDLTSGRAGGGHFGGATGGDVYGAGKGPAIGQVTPADESQVSERYGSPEETERLLEQQAATANLRALHP